MAVFAALFMVTARNLLHTVLALGVSSLAVAGIMLTLNAKDEGKMAQAAAFDAGKLLDLAHKRLNASAWPYPIVAYLRKEISKEALLSLATDNDKMTEARAYMGLALAATGERQEALKQLQWVKENGNKSFVEFPAALMELRRLEQTDVDRFRQRL